MYCRESNAVRLSSQVSRSARLFRAAMTIRRENPCKPTRNRASERGLAYLAMRAKLKYVRACLAGCDFATAHKLGARYHAAHANWNGEYLATTGY